MSKYKGRFSIAENYTSDRSTNKPEPRQSHDGLPTYELYLADG